MRPPVLVLLVCLALPGCSGGSSDGARAAATPTVQAASSAVPDIVLPPGPLRELVPATADLPPGMVPIVAASGPRDLAAVAGYSADPVAARKLLAEHGFRTAYAAQYSDPATGWVLSVVVTQFSATAGAAADLAGDLAASVGTRVSAAPIGEQAEVRLQPVPQASGSATSAQLATVRFRKGSTTWLVAYRASPTADPGVAVTVARKLVDRV